MDNIKKIAEFIEEGCNRFQRVGLELEHFVCNSEYEVIPYEEMSKCLYEICGLIEGRPFEEDGRIFGIFSDDYSVSIEPGCQIEISITPKERVEDIGKIYAEFRKVCDKVFNAKGYFLLEKGVFPLIENGTLDVNALPLIPKKRYLLMDAYFTKSGKYGKYMMRATASTQISFDFSSQEDAMKKMRVLEKLSPILSLITENKNGIGTDRSWNEHLLRNRIWGDLDSVRCGYFENSLSEDYSFYEYARHVYCNPCILMKHNGSVVNLQDKSAADYYKDKEIETDSVEHVLSMFFPMVRLKKYIEYRVADSMPVDKALGYAALMKAIVYNADILDDLDKRLQGIERTAEIYQAEALLGEYGYKAVVYGKPVSEWLSYILEKASGVSDETEKKLIGKLIPLPVVNYQYKQLVAGSEEKHISSALGIRNYLGESTAKYHNRVVRTLYLPKLFTEHEMEIFKGAVTVLYGIFDKVIKEFEANPEYRSLFGFPDELTELILRENKYGCNIPIARIDLFYNEETGDFKFCEFNTDGTSAMNEDRELNIAFRKSDAFMEFAKKYRVTSYELFDTWVDEAIKLYSTFVGDDSAIPGVAIVDFMENATFNEFMIFKERFEQKGCRAQVCDIRRLRWNGRECLTDEGSKVDVIYRRAVTSDIMAHFSEVSDFIATAKSGKVCLLGDFRTQIVHNKILFKILHMDATMRLLTKKEQIFIRAHVPYTVSLDSAVLAENKQLSDSVYGEKDRWIIKPEDSYGSLGVHAGVECDDESEWKTLVEECTDRNYILQEFTNPYRLDNIDLAAGGQEWVSTSNLTGLFVYSGKFSGIYSRISFDKMISTQYNEMSLPTMVVGDRSDVQTDEFG